MGGGNVTIEEWLQPISSDSPCGPNLEYDADFLKLEEAARATPDQEFGRDGGEAIRIQGASADWREVQGLAESLLARSKDLRGFGFTHHEPPFAVFNVKICPPRRAQFTGAHEPHHG